MDELKETLAANLVRCRKRAGLTQAEVAEKINYSDKAVSKWERGEGLPDLAVLVRLADLYGVTLDYFVSAHEGEKTPVPDGKKRKLIAVLCSCGLVWLVATLIFVFLGLFEVHGKIWLAFVVAVPATFVLLTVFAALWSNRYAVFVAVTGLIWTIALAVFLSWEIAHVWMVFLAAVPLQVLAVFWFILRPQKTK